MSVEFEFSAGGVVTDSAGNLVIIRTSNFAGEARLALPKGRVDRGESALEAALREVREETGLEVEALADTPAAVIEYWFVRPSTRARVKKKVTLFRFRAVGGNTADHDEEVDEVLVLPLDEALDRLSYPGEVQAVREALAS